MASCPVAMCLAQISDGRVIKLNERFLILADCQTSPAPDPASMTLEIWSDSLDREKLKTRLKVIHTLRDVRVSFRINPAREPVVANAGLSFITFAGTDCMLIFLEELSQSRKVERALEAARDAALESARLKSEFLANISHEIRTPLNGVIGMTCLLRDTKLGSLQRNFTETIRISADNLLNLINEILDFSKLEAGKLVVENAPFDLVSTVEDTLDLLAERAHSKGLELAYLVSPDVPTQLVGDAGRCRQILTNLISNAIKFTAEGEVALTVSLTENADASQEIYFEIRDTGIGIPEAALPDLFESFHQVDSSTSRKYGGTGLGLAISRQLVDVMGGSIGVESTPGRGSSFWFSIPQKLQVDIAGPLPVPDRLTKSRVLLIEENQTNATNILTILQHHGIEAGHAATGPDALAILREGARENRPFEIAILDMDTPGMDGLTLARAIKAEQSISGTRILILTTVTHQVETNLLNASNIGACLTKPLKQSKLPDYLLAALSESAGQRPANIPLPDITDTFSPFLLPHGGVPPRIIIAEDNSINQKVAKGLLARMGFASEIVSDGRALLRALELTPRDIVFMDCQLPILDGLQATRELRSREQSSKSDHRTYVIAMTADAIPGAREKCITAGMNDYLSKPIRPEELQAVLRRAIEMVNLSAKNGSQRHPYGFIDPSVMETLRLLKTPGQPDPLPLLIDEYVGAAQHRLEELQAALIDRNISVIETAAHSLRGSSAGIGAVRLASLSAEMEDGVRNGSFNQSAAVLSQMDEEFLLVKTALEFEKER